MNELLKDREPIEADIASFRRPEAKTPDAMDNFGNADGFSDAPPAEKPVIGPDHDRLVADDNGPLQSNALFATEELRQFRSNWNKVQVSFVDEPRAAVQQADALVADVVNRITEQFASERERLESQWARGEDANTEELRQRFKRYRAFFDRLLSLKGDEMPIAETPTGR
jgi:hypothetical protein